MLRFASVTLENHRLGQQLSVIDIYTFSCAEECSPSSKYYSKILKSIPRVVSTTCVFCSLRNVPALLYLNSGRNERQHFFHCLNSGDSP